MNVSKELTSEVHFRTPNQYCPTGNYLLATLSIFTLALVHAAIIYTIVTLSLDSHNVRIDKYAEASFIIYSITLAGFLLCYPVFVMIFIRPSKLIRYLQEGYSWHLFSKERLLFSYPILVIIPLDKSIYTSFKTEIPHINPFWLDAPLYKLDQLAFLGHDPWIILQGIGNNPDITRIIDHLYHPAWLLLLVTTFLFHALGRHSLNSRLRFFLSYIIVWTGLGNALATVLSSAGPCYYDLVTGQASPYTELMASLNAMNEPEMTLNAIRLQEKLWTDHMNTALEYGSGISAMPSIHVATTTLLALSMRRHYPVLEKLLYCYTLLIWIGSIHLGWHYALDGIVSVLLVLPIWHYSGKLTSRILGLLTPRP